jgi:hypothetical protein
VEPGHHLLIAGTGRAGTTVLVQLLDACGLETGSESLAYSPQARAGLETRLYGTNAPYVVKHPYLYDELAILIRNGFDPVRIDGIIVPLRDLDDAAASRIEVFLDTGEITVDGGLWRSLRPGEQKPALAISLHELLVTAADHNIPLYFLMFPRFVTDPEYAWRCLSPVVPSTSQDHFIKKHREIVRPDLVHEQRHIGRVQMARFDLKYLWWKVRNRHRIRT